MHIGQKLKLRRKKAGYTQEQVAEKMNITRQTLSNWEVGKYYPDIDSIIRLSRIYKISLEELLLGKIHFKGELVMAKKLMEEEMKALIKNHDPAAKNVKELNGGLASQTYSFESGDHRYIFQVGNYLKAYEKERFIYKNYHKILPVRKVVTIQKTGDGAPYSISHFIEGDKLFDLNSQELLDIVPAVLKILEDLESIEVSDTEGYGYFDRSGHAAYPTWLNFIKAVDNENIYDWTALERNGLDSEVVHTAIQELRSHINCVNGSKKSMINGDLGSFNLLAKGGHITGVIGWKLALYGDSLYDKANILFWNEDKLQPLIQQIKSKYVTSPEIKEKMYCYMLRIGLEEIYNTVILKEAGYEIEWVANRLQEIMDSYL